MTIIEPSVELIQESNPFKKIEMAGRTCYEKGTEILTNNGFKAVENITSADLVLTYNSSQNTLEYQDSNMVVQEFVGKLICSNHPNIRFAVTPTHRMFVSKPYRRLYKFVEAHRLFESYKNNNTSWRIPKYFDNVTRNIEDLKVNINTSKEINRGFLTPMVKTIDFILNDDFLILLAAYIAEGHTRHGEGKGYSSHVAITQTENTELYNMVENALKNLNITYHIDCDPRKPYIAHFIFGDQVYVQLFEELCGRYSANKHLPKWFRQLSNRQLNILIKTLYLGDGSHNVTRHDKYLSVSKQLLEEVQECFILMGTNATVSYNSEKSQYCYTEENLRDSWIVSQKHLSYKEYNGLVYCPSTINGVVCIRYQNKTMWCGNCYKSEANITDESALKFYQRLADNKHTAMLEHATFIFDVSGCDYCYELGCRDEITAHKFLNITSAVINGETRTLLSGNLRAINESNIGDLLYSLYRYDPKLVYNYNKYSESQFKRNMGLHNGDEVKDFWQFPIVKLSDYDNLTEEEIAVHTYTTMKFICDRGVSHELVRHRPFSFAQESTRYVNYSKEQNGDGNIKFIRPADYNSWDLESQAKFLLALNGAEQYYNDMISKGRTPQEARAVLPNAVKTEIIVTGNGVEWNHFFNLRHFGTTGKPHPDMQVVADMAYEIYKNI